MNLVTFISFLLLPNQPINTVAARRDTARIDTSKYSVLAYNKSRDGFIFNGSSSAATLSVAEVKMIEKIIKVTVTEYNEQARQARQLRAKQQGDKLPAEVSFNNMISKPDRYYKQLIAVINEKGEKEVWVNCFCTNHEKRYWRKGIVMVLDGGPCFFNIKINLNTNTVLKFDVNGVA